MSSLGRRMQIRMMKNAGYCRSKHAFRRDAEGNAVKVSVRKGCMIYNQDDVAVGYRWPN
jgi:uncharacterized protein (DUF2126 family)